MLTDATLGWASAETVNQEVTSVAPITHSIQALCDKTSPQLFHEILSGEDGLQTLISDITSEDAVDGATDDAIQMSSFWDWSHFSDFSQSPAATSSPEYSGSEAVVPIVNSQVQAMVLDRPSEVPISPETEISNFFLEENLSPGTPVHSSATPEPFPLSNGIILAPRALSYDLQVGEEHSTPPHAMSTRVTTVPKTPQKARKRVTKHPSPTTKARAKRVEKIKPCTIFNDDVALRSEKSKQSARDCRRRKKLYIESITKKAKEYAQRNSERLAKIQSLKDTVRQLEQVCREMGLNPSSA
mmetsp:Transcript_3587/g.11186  ORF Transcript_3587/g.11186 Transcript_3587/m.11186 type:complete len:299 (-) Transcript_3587:80-976(-)|eukprot:CAMPEP_0206301968 /NCGR_PEP_ID=MMETSP0106_2-20121207/8483_1 /ASSEMBLY_ACC=CAM_ASM_000206 /TAXON_ID=81532 /ORGANISM="Acanthoeca-like sp., Strain 10tr" /LENGTH=298 /DNA_ID=CAMNT_0053732725 /DNA_START=412 /DNA_END=1308 /DNA_ORIENTATION=+